MGDVVFARPRWDYGSYDDLYTLIGLAGYRLIYFDEIDLGSDNTYILTIINGENMQGYPDDARARLILWDLEWRLDDSGLPGIDEVWASDYWYAQRIGARYVLLGSDPLLNLAPDIPEIDKLYDVAMMQYLTHRREHVYNRLRDCGLAMAPNGWGWERHDALSRSKIMLHVHQHDNIPTVAPLRWALAAAYRLPVVSETVESLDLYNPPPSIFVPYERLPDCVPALVKDTLTLRVHADALYAYLCEIRTFKRCVEENV